MGDKTRRIKEKGEDFILKMWYNIGRYLIILNTRRRLLYIF